MDDIPWLYVAMIFIAFISWVHNRIQEAKEYRRARKIEKEKARARKSPAAPDYQSPYRGQPVPDSVREVEEPKTFREVFQELERQFTEPEFEEPVAESRPSPPPLPSDPPAYSVDDIPDQPLKTAPPMSTTRRRPGQGRNTGSYLVKTLRDGGNLKTALILKEVLDKPRALRSR